MEALRIVQRPQNGRITIDLPAEFPIQEEVEIIVLPFKEKKEDKKTFDPRKFFGAANLNISEEQIDQQCRKLRDEWERNF
jgi:hypothetical protein